MLHLIIGGSGSGKSAYAEDWLLANKKEDSLVYLATMIPYGGDGRKKVERHQRLRKGKGFRTVECYRDIQKAVPSEPTGLLLECLSNLVANELYGEDGQMQDSKRVERKIMEGICRLKEAADPFVIVSCEVHTDVENYTEETNNYRQVLGRLHQQIARMAEKVTEVVYGIPVEIKDEKTMVE